MKMIAEIVLVCSHSEIALRGHRKSPHQLIGGILLEILELVQNAANHDQVIRRRLTDGPRNATYTSAGIQNELLNVMGSIVQKADLCRLQKSWIVFNFGR